MSTHNNTNDAVLAAALWEKRKAKEEEANIGWHAKKEKAQKAEQRRLQKEEAKRKQQEKELAKKQEEIERKQRAEQESIAKSFLQQKEELGRILREEKQRKVIKGMKEMWAAICGQRMMTLRGEYEARVEEERRLMEVLQVQRELQERYYMEEVAKQQQLENQRQFLMIIQRPDEEQQTFREVIQAPAQPIMTSAIGPSTRTFKFSTPPPTPLPIYLPSESPAELLADLYAEFPHFNHIHHMRIDALAATDLANLEVSADMKGIPEEYRWFMRYKIVRKWCLVENEAFCARQQQKQSNPKVDEEEQKEEDTCNTEMQEKEAAPELSNCVMFSLCVVVAVAMVAEVFA
ncbi:hypothetical protein K440DRAFT_639318 [Wilcoxina mikolae CBS 423.85]|nr:hypothetical protein K440DRAFT_639318 [Wilcoxina mikolae CBS 423.85]